MAGILYNNKIIIQQLSDLVSQFNNDEYSEKLATFNGSSIGMHVRHILEFYTCCLDQINGDHVCYDSRQRKLIFEVDVPSTLEELKTIQDRIEKISIDQEIKIKTNTSEEEGENDYVASSAGREMLYTLDHAIHHMAIIKIGVNLHFKNKTFAEGFGVAPSTIRHQKKCAQ